MNIILLLVLSLLSSSLINGQFNLSHCDQDVLTDQWPDDVIIEGGKYVAFYQDLIITIDKDFKGRIPVIERIVQEPNKTLANPGAVLALNETVKYYFLANNTICEYNNQTFVRCDRKNLNIFRELLEYSLELDATTSRRLQAEHQVSTYYSASLTTNNAIYLSVQKEVRFSLSRILIESKSEEIRLRVSTLSNASYNIAARANTTISRVEASTAVIKDANSSVDLYHVFFSDHYGIYQLNAAGLFGSIVLTKSHSSSNHWLGCSVNICFEADIDSALKYDANRILVTRGLYASRIRIDRFAPPSNPVQIQENNQCISFGFN